MLNLKINVVVIDFDRTLVNPKDSFIINENVRNELESLTAAGIIKILATGRVLSKIPDKSVFHLFDMIIAENGCLIYDCKSNYEIELAPMKWKAKKIQIERILNEEGIKFNSGNFIISVKKNASIESFLKNKLPEYEFQLESNADDIMVLPEGIDKGYAIKKAMGDKKFSAGIGDNINDLKLFEAVDIRIAVANAEQVLKDKADVVTSIPYGNGVAEALSSIRLGKMIIMNDNVRKSVISDFRDK